MRTVMRNSFRWRVVGLLMMLTLRAGAALAQAPAWQWALAPGNGVYARSAVDAAGNMYVIGTFLTVTLGTITLTSTGGYDVFVAKLSRNGTYQWVARLGGVADDAGNAIAVDATGNVYVTGSFKSSVVAFGPTISLTNTGATDAFVAKLNTAGVWEWAVKGGGTYDDYSYNLTVDDSGNTYVTGEFDSSTATFGPAAGSPITLVNSQQSSSNTFVAKLNAAGIYQWVTSATSSSIGVSVEVNSNGQVYISGFYQYSPVTFGSIVLPQPIGPLGVRDLFVARLTAAGVWDWAIGVSSINGIKEAEVMLDGSGDLLVRGSFSGHITLGATTLTSDAGSLDVFVAKLNPTGSGVWTWAVRAGGPGYDFSRGLALDGSGNAYITGAFNSPAFSLGTTILTNVGFLDVFVAKLTPTGTWQWATQAGGTDSEEGFGVSIDGNGGVYVTGSFYSNSVSFGSTLLPRYRLGQTLFFARLGAAGDELPEDLTFAPFPNPATTTVQLTGITAPTATLLDALGRPVRVWSLTTGTGPDLSLAGIVPGVYVVRAGTAARRLVVE